MSESRSHESRDLTWLIALAASMWGFSSLLRDPLSKQLPALTVVLAEHFVLVLMVLPWVVPALRAMAAASARTKVSVIVIGAGSSALATTLFTAAFRIGDPVTPQVLQKLQPVLAILLAAVLLAERVTRHYALFAVPAILGAWLLAFPDPLGVGVQSLAAAALAVGAALLWAAGTVLGRLASSELSFVHVTTLRFVFGLVTLAACAAFTGTSAAVPFDLVPQLIALAAIPGLIALVLYYRALRQTPAARATLAELAFPLTAAAVGVLVLGASLDLSQWCGFAVVVTAVVLLTLHEHKSRRPAVATPERADEALK